MERHGFPVSSFLSQRQAFAANIYLIAVDPDEVISDNHHAQPVIEIAFLPKHSCQLHHALELTQYCQQTAEAARAASYQLASLDASVKNKWLTESADALASSTERIMEANQQDLAAAPEYGLTSAAIDRLRLDTERIAAIATGITRNSDAS